MIAQRPVLALDQSLGARSLGGRLPREAASDAVRLSVSSWPSASVQLPSQFSAWTLSDRRYRSDRARLPPLPGCHASSTIGGRCAMASRGPPCSPSAMASGLFQLDGQTTSLLEGPTTGSHARQPVRTRLDLDRRHPSVPAPFTATPSHSPERFCGVTK